MNLLEKYRKQIDKTNHQILKSLKKRQQISKKIKTYKKEKKIKIINSKREKIMLQKIIKKAKDYDLDKKYINNIFKIIIKNSKELQK